MLSDTTEIVYEQEIPLVTQVLTAQAEVISYQPEYYFTPEECAKLGYEKVYAITVRFRQKSVSEQEQESVTQADDQDEMEYAVLAPNDFGVPATEEEKQAALLRQAQDRLTDMISGMDNVEEASVAVDVDADGTRYASVSIILSDGKALTDELKDTIRTFVVSSVSEMKKENVDVAAVESLE